MAAVVAAIEVMLFAAIIYILRISYLLATPMSMTFAILLNWYLGGKFVFKGSVHSPKKEFVLVLVVCVVGLGIQLAVTTFATEILNIWPVFSKIIAIGVTFFWNFFVRQTYIYKSDPGVE